jgi:glyoxylate/hydroxypyruvate reductase A
MKIYIHTLLNPALTETLKKAFASDHELFFRAEGKSDAEAAAAFDRSEAVLGNPPLDWFQKGLGSGLKFWQLDSAGFDQYKAVATSAKVANMGDWFAWPCAETIVGGVLALYRGLHVLTLLKQDKKWIGAPLREELTLLHTKRALVLGAGTIGLAVRSILNGFGTDVRLVARSSPHAEIHSREELLVTLPEIDLVINTLPGAAGRYVDRDFLQTMKPQSVYANVGRGSTTDETALLALLNSGHLAGAVLDVTEQEPLPADNPLWSLENVIITQHTGGGQFNEDRGKADMFIQNFSRYLAGESIQHEVSLSKGY